MKTKEIALLQAKISEVLQVKEIMIIGGTRNQRLLEWFAGGLDLLLVALVRDELFRKSITQIQGIWKGEVDVYKEEKCRICVLV